MLESQKCPNCGAPLDRPIKSYADYERCEYCGVIIHLAGKPAPPPPKQLLQQSQVSKKKQKGMVISLSLFVVFLAITIIAALGANTNSNIESSISEENIADSQAPVDTTLDWFSNVDSLLSGYTNQGIDVKSIEDTLDYCKIPWIKSIKLDATPDKSMIDFAGEKIFLISLNDSTKDYDLVLKLHGDGKVFSLSTLQQTIFHNNSAITYTQAIAWESQDYDTMAKSIISSATGATDAQATAINKILKDCNVGKIQGMKSFQPFTKDFQDEKAYEIKTDKANTTLSLILDANNKTHALQFLSMPLFDMNKGVVGNIDYTYELYESFNDDSNSSYKFETLDMFLKHTLNIDPDQFGAINAYATKFNFQDLNEFYDASSVSSSQCNFLSQKNKAFLFEVHLNQNSDDLIFEANNGKIVNVWVYDSYEKTHNLLYNNVKGVVGNVWDFIKS